MVNIRTQKKIQLNDGLAGLCMHDHQRANRLRAPRKETTNRHVAAIIEIRLHFFIQINLVETSQNVNRE